MPRKAAVEDDQDSEEAKRDRDASAVCRDVEAATERMKQQILKREESQRILSLKFTAELLQRLIGADEKLRQLEARAVEIVKNMDKEIRETEDIMHAGYAGRIADMRSHQSR
ncbi:hypothetical protein B0I35DRAFT_473319 [Stachybotrys elegans]|uniref:Uncharacterized protein n=1 Tax=Stachybotrys elegans TaxID=80388 RepID=A0A8K0WY87_9HYPO|nr:hypothetical protein B0I35DRAFT_473319 [Stachybotrys elegans]